MEEFTQQMKGATVPVPTRYEERPPRRRRVLSRRSLRLRLT
jgi:hypothetical protein